MCIKGQGRIKCEVGQEKVAKTVLSLLSTLFLHRSQWRICYERKGEGKLGVSCLFALSNVELHLRARDRSSYPKNSLNNTLSGFKGQMKRK